MSFVHVSFSKRIRWYILKDDPGTLNLHSRPGWFLINPLANRYVSSSLVVKFYAIVDSGVLAETNAIIFFSPVGENFDTDEFREYVNQLVRNIRYFSKQPDLGGIYIDSIYVIYSLFDGGELELLPFLSPEWPSTYQSVRFNYRIPKYRLDTAVTWGHIVAADSVGLEYKPPVFDAFLLDAIAALNEGDYKRSILYAAMSVEVMAAEKLDEAYSFKKQNGDPDSRLRIISIPQRGGVTITKDPVYEYLINKADFKHQLHEIPLYILERSLLLEKEQLYQTALKLYRTRNKIAHTGEPPVLQEDTYFYNKKPDAMKAIECSVDIFQWFGVSNAYKLPSSLMVEALFTPDEETMKDLKKIYAEQDLKEDDSVEKYEDEDDIE